MKISLIVVLMLTEQCYSGVHVELTSNRTKSSLHNNTIVYFDDVFVAKVGIKCNTSATEVKWLRPNGTHVSEFIYNNMLYTLYVVRARNNSQTETLLHLGDNNFNEQGIYTCKATDGSQSQTLHIGIYNREDDIPAISIAQPITLQYTDHLSFTLNCSSSGSPATNVTWYRNGTRLNGFAQTKILRNTSSSSYDNLLYVRDGMAGQYECEVENNIIEPPSSKTINYVVPAVLSGLNVTQIGMTFARVAWEIPDSYVENYTLYYQGGCMNDTKWLWTDLNVVNLTGLDSGIDTYSISLSAHNALGSSPNMTLNLKTIGRAPAGSPLHLTIVSLGPTSISLQWSELECAQRGGTITGYMLEYKESIRNEWMSLIVPKERAEVGNLTESTTYLFRIAAMNVNGTGPFSDIETGISTAKPSTLPTYVIAAVVLTGSLLAVVLCSLVCVIVCLYRGRAKVVSDGPEDIIEISDYSVDEIDGEEPVIDYFPENVTACVGEYTVIQVLVSGNPRPSISWTHEGSEVTNDTTIEQANDGTLIIPSAESCHEGVYCMAATNMYGAVTKQLFLSLEGEEIEEQGVRLVLSESMPIPLDCFGDYVTKNHENSNEGFQMQFMCLSSEPDKTTDVANNYENKALNRFKNIVTYDDNRIVLSSRPLPGSSDFQHDYINASYINGYTAPNKYIATQGPLPHTVIDFWWMVWQEQCSCIVMLNNVIEGGRVRCQQYWPNYHSHSYGPFTVELLKEEHFTDYTARTLTIELTSAQPGINKSITLEQLHFTAWPDHLVPSNAGPLLRLYKRMLLVCSSSPGPVLVHCSTGVGRTGTFIAISIALEQAAAEKVVDIAGITNRMRQQRMKMVQSPVQYIFIHDSVLETLVCGETQVSTTNLRIAMNKLGKVDLDTGLNGYEQQHKLLQRITPKPYELGVRQSRYDMTSTSSMELFEREQRRLDGINGMYIDGYKRKKVYIMMEDPLKENCCDLWRIIHQQEIAIIVMFSALEENQQEHCFQYWPSAGSVEYGEYKVRLDDEAESPSFTTRSLQVTPNTNEGHTVTVTHFEVLNWTLEAECADLPSVVKLTDKLHSIQMTTGNNPIIVHSRDPVGCCAVFVALMTAIQQCNHEYAVNVLQVVKGIRMQKPGAVCSAKQYRLIFDLVSTYLDSMSGYQNFKPPPQAN